MRYRSESRGQGGPDYDSPRQQRRFAGEPAGRRAGGRRGSGRDDWDESGRDGWGDYGRRSRPHRWRYKSRLAKAGYVAIDKRFDGKRPQTRVRATPVGRKAFADHVTYLRSLLDNA